MQAGKDTFSGRFPRRKRLPVDLDDDLAGGLAAAQQFQPGIRLCKRQDMADMRFKFSLCIPVKQHFETVCQNFGVHTRVPPQ